MVLILSVVNVFMGEYRGPKWRKTEMNENKKVKKKKIKTEPNLVQKNDQDDFFGQFCQAVRFCRLNFHP